MILKHICEVCEKIEVIDSDLAFDEGWDYPPRMGSFRNLSPEPALTARLKKLCGGH